jgi:hypothetical protein
MFKPTFAFTCPAACAVRAATLGAVRRVLAVVCALAAFALAGCGGDIARLESSSGIDGETDAETTSPDTSVPDTSLAPFDGPPVADSGIATPDASIAESGLTIVDASPPPNGVTPIAFDAAALATSAIVFKNNPDPTRGSLRSGVEATFFPSDFYMGCVIMTDGACTYVDCSFAANVASLNAGTMTFAGGQLAGGVAVPYDPSGEYLYPANSSTFFQAGDALTASAQGAAIPAFSAQTVIAPGYASLDVPASDDAGTYRISSSEDLVVQWSGGEPGATFLLQLSQDATGYWVSCVWDSTLSQGTVPQAILYQFALVAQPTFAALEWGQMTGITFVVGSNVVTQTAIQYDTGLVTFE